MGRIIINNRSELPDSKALEMCLSVINKGRVSNSNKQYCFLTRFKLDGVEYDVATDLRKGSDSFTVYYSPYNDKKFSQIASSQYA